MTSTIVRLVVVTVTLVSVTSEPFNVTLSTVGRGVASMEKESVTCPFSVGVAVAVEGENWGGSAEQRDTVHPH